MPTLVLTALASPLRLRINTLAERFVVPLLQRQNFYQTFIVPQPSSAGLPLSEHYDPSLFDQIANAYIAMLQSD
nr:hypothetical protein [Xylella fastidiosa]